MKPLLLRVSAFGPFRETECLDFEALTPFPLFLIHGVTGAGKSSLLDAITFALYGESAAGMRRPRDLRCHYAPSQLATAVEFCFALGDQRFRLTRMPEQRIQKPLAKKKQLEGVGPAWKQVRASAKLEEIAGSADGVVVSGNAAVTAWVEKTLGLASEQFRQVIVLPQGKFQRFLLSSSAEKNELLEQLFGTGVFLAVENQLSSKAQKLELEWSQLQARLQARLDNLELSSIGELDVELQAKSAAQKVQLQAATKAAHELEVAHERLSKTKREAEEYATWQKAEERLRRLEEELPRVEEAQRRLQGAEAAQRVLPSLERLEKVTEMLGQAERRRNSLGREGKESGLQLERAEKCLKEAMSEHTTEKLRASESEVREAEAVLGQIALLKEKVNQHRQAEERFFLAKKKAEACQALESTQRELLAQMPVWLMKKQEAQEQKLDWVEKVKRLEEAKRLLAAARRQLPDNGGSRKAEETSAKSGDWQRWVEAFRHESQNVGHCVVCGSPALGHGLKEILHGCGVPTGATLLEQMALVEQLLSEAKTQLRELEQRGVQAQQSLARAEGEISRFRKQADELGDAAAAGALDQTREQLAKFRAELSHALRLILGVDALEGEPREYFDQVATRKQKSLRAADLGRAQILEITREREAAAADVKQKAAACQRVSQELGRLQGSLEQMQAEHNDLSARLKTELHQEGFATAAQVSKAVLEPKERERLFLQVETHSKQRSQTVAFLEQARTQVAAEWAEPGRLEVAERAVEVCRSSHQECTESLAALNTRLSNLRRGREFLQDLQGQMERKESAFRTTGTVASLVRGQNSSKLSLRRYVMSVLMETVLEVASERLRQMSRSRYCLVRSELPQDRRRAAGLDLSVIDSHSGEERPVTTLSGGESFMASLSLALALSDVVQAHAGGLRLEALFLDEGFGTLDSDALDQAISCLEKVGQSGRSIGLISHVRELKERVPVRVEVLSHGVASDEAQGIGHGVLGSKIVAPQVPSPQQTSGPMATHGSYPRPKGRSDLALPG